MLFIAACAPGLPFGGGAPPVAADESAIAFVTKIYDAYKGEDSKGVSIDSAAALRRYFEPSLAALINKDEKAAARRHEVGTLEKRSLH